MADIHETNAAAQSLHDQIMRLPCNPPDYMNADLRHAHREGHRVARHAAAELAAEHEADAPVAVPGAYRDDSRVPDDYQNAAAGYRAGWNDCRAAVLAAAPTPPAQQPVAVPNGWRMVPVEPTHEMLMAYCGEQPANIAAYLSDGVAPYKAMLAAAPTPPAGQGESPCTLPAQQSQADGRRDGIEAVAKMIEKQASEYAMEFGNDDLGALSFGAGSRAEAKHDYYNTLCELAEEVRAMLAAPGDTAAPDQPKCKTCGGTGFVDDGEIWCSEGGIPYENGPVKCVKDCPECSAAPEQAEQPKCDVCRDVGIVGHSDICPACSDSWQPPAERVKEQAEQPHPVNRSVIRDVFLRNGFTIKEGHSDLKPYVYAAAEELLALDEKAVAAEPDAVTVPRELLGGGE